MVQGVENLTAISGRIVGRKAHLTLEGFDVVTIELDSAEPIAGKADLLTQFRGQLLDVTVRRDLLAGMQSGGRFRCRAKRTFEGAMCEKDPAPGDFIIE